MDKYEEAYFKLFNSITDVIEKLKEVQCQAEDLYIEYGNPNEIRPVVKARRKGSVTK